MTRPEAGETKGGRVAASVGRKVAGAGPGVPPKGHKVSFGGDENFLKLTVISTTQQAESQWAAHFECVKCT